MGASGSKILNYNNRSRANSRSIAQALIETGRMKFNVAVFFVKKVQPDLPKPQQIEVIYRDFKRSTQH